MNGLVHKECNNFIVRKLSLMIWLDTLYDIRNTVVKR